MSYVMPIIIKINGDWFDMIDGRRVFDDNLVNLYTILASHWKMETTLTELKFLDRKAFFVQLKHMLQFTMNSQREMCLLVNPQTKDAIRFEGTFWHCSIPKMDFTGWVCIHTHPGGFGSELLSRGDIQAAQDLQLQSITALKPSSAHLFLTKSKEITWFGSTEGRKVVSLLASLCDLV